MADSRRANTNAAANVAAVALILALVAGVLVWQKPWTSKPQPADPIPPHAGVILDGQFDALSGASSRSAFVKAAGSSAAARRFAADVWAARRDLGIGTVAMNYDRGGTAPDRADGSTSARVVVRWASSTRSPWGATQPSTVPVRFRAVPRGRHFEIVAAEPAGDNQLPPWLAGRARVETSGVASVVTIDGGSDDVDAVPMARAAARKVTRLWPGSRPKLCVIVPHTRQGAAALLGDTSKDVRQLASVTTAIAEDGQAAAIVINPVEWATMDPSAQQIVMTHEAVHAMTGAVGRRVNKLVAEGFADYIALYGDRRPLAVSAGQILRRVEVSGAPRQLPSSADFSESADGLGAVYESAWMLFRMLGEQFGKDAVVAFYRQVLDGAGLESATRQSFGLTVAELTGRWRSYLTKSASMVS